VEVGKKIKQIRELKDYTQEYMADKLGIAIRSYSKLESGETRLTVDKLYEISEILGVSVPEILGFNVAMIFNNNPTYNKGGNFFAYNNTEVQLVRELYEKHIQYLTEENQFLRDRLNKQDQKE